MSDSLTAGMSALWIQPDGPNTKPYYLGCHTVGDVTIPKGAKTPKYCPDPAMANAFKVDHTVRGAPDMISTAIEGVMKRTADYLEDMGTCDFPFYVHKVETGRRDTFNNFVRSFAFEDASITQEGLSALSTRTPDDNNESLQTFELQASKLVRAFKLAGARVSITESEDINGIAVGGEYRCATDSVRDQKPQDYMFAASKHVSASAGNKAQVLKSVSGAAWTATAADPFAGGADVNAIASFRIDADTIRVLAARGTVAGGPAQVAFSDDLGATWTTVAVNAVNASFAPYQHSLYAMDRYHIWLGLSNGFIHFSEDGGETWTAQEAGVISATDVVAISMFDIENGYAIYEGGQVAKTTDGGVTWSATTVSGLTAARSIVAVNVNFVYAVGDEGMFYTHDGGLTWAQRNSYACAAIDFYGSLLAVAVGSANSGRIYYTINGGYDWMTLPLVANTGLLDVVIITPKLAYVTGKASGGTGVIVKLEPAS